MKHRHFILYKPVRFISQFVYPHKRKKGLLGDLFDFPEGTMAIGRLDVMSEGLLLLTTDGKESERIRSNKIEKEYFVQVDGLLTSEAIAQLKEGVEIVVEKEKYLTKPCKAKLLDSAPSLPERGVKIRDERHGPTSWASITITEGKFRQVRKMTAAVGFPTLRLVRFRVGEISIDDLNVGEVREVTSFDS
ncbi:MAG: pseudouridine synthase [Cyclobacteriaceae bacterium]